MDIMTKAIIKPNADGTNNEWDYFGATSRTQAISKETTQPNEPNTTSFINTAGLSNYQEHLLENIENATFITQLDIWIYGQATDPTDPNTNISIVTPQETINCGDIQLVTIAGWKHLQITELNIAKTDFDDTYIRIISGDYGGNEGKIHEIYIDVTYTESEPEPSGADPLPKRNTKSSAYNYFVKNYIARKAKDLVPYRTPDGVLYDE